MANQRGPVAGISCLGALLLWSALSCRGPAAERAPADEPSASAGEAPSAGTTERTVMPDSAIIAAQEELTKTVMALPGVTGTAVGLCGDAVCIKVYLTSPDQTVVDRIPESFKGFKVDVEVIGEIRAR